MDFAFLLLAFLIAVAITASAVYALGWASRNGQLRNFEQGAASIFDESEPIGKQTDFFPKKQLKRRTPGVTPRS
ncbi:hypothetical protein [Nibricoccus sp. IMCC34717]|uniref:hypothetical protein n=1 Tax=Nibricoccus sp. IMCC34717 TaxID=3034021 RepID=UPI00384C981D